MCIQCFLSVLPRSCNTLRYSALYHIIIHFIYAFDLFGRSPSSISLLWCLFNTTLALLLKLICECLVLPAILFILLFFLLLCGQIIARYVDYGLLLSHRGLLLLSKLVGWSKLWVIWVLFIRNDFCAFLFFRGIRLLLTLFVGHRCLLRLWWFLF